MNYKRAAKKAAAVSLAAAMATAGCTGVWAEETWSSVEQAALDRATENVGAEWDDMISRYETTRKEGASSNLTLKVEDTGRAILGSLFESGDASWLDSVSLKLNTGVSDGMEAIAGDILLNDTSLTGLKIYMDLADMMEYIGLPDLAEGYLTDPLQSNTVAGSGETSIASDEAATQFLKTYINVLTNLSEYAPDGETAETLLNRYGSLLIEGMEDGAVTEETLSVEGIEEDCTVYEAAMDAEGLVNTTAQILTTVKDDEEIKALFEKWGNDQYEEFQTSVEGVLAQAQEAVSSEDNSLEAIDITADVWVNADGKIEGQKIEVADTAALTWQAPENGENSALLLEVAAEGSDTSSTITLSGSGTTTGDALNGNYFLAVNGSKLIDIEAKDLITDKESKTASGELTLSIAEEVTQANEESEDTEDSVSSTASAYAGFELAVVYDIDEAAGTEKVDLTLSMSDAPLATLTLESAPGDEEVEVPDAKDLTPTYSMDDTDALNEYISGLDMDGLAEKLKAAGVPEDLVEDITSAFEESQEETESAEDAEADEDSETEAAE